jgi:hypothetical protein
MSLFDDIDLGADDYSGEKKDSLSQFTSKPVQKKYQPFGGQMPQAPQPQYEPIDYGYEVQPAQRPSNVFDELDAYDGIKKAHGQFKQYATENERSAKHYEGLYDDFVKNEFQPFFNSVGGFGDFDNDDEMLSFIDQMKAEEVKASQEEDGFFGGSSDRKIAAQENLKKFGAWDSTNGLRDKYLRLKAEKDRRRQTADAARNQEFQLFEQLTNIPIPARDAMDAQLKARSASPKSKKATDDLLNQYSFEAPIVDHMTGEVINLEKTDPRKAVPSATDHLTGKTSKSFDAQKQRLSAAMRGDIDGVLARRDLVKKERNLRDKGIFFSQNGLIDGRPIGLSRNDVDLLDIAEMKAAGMTSYRGKPLELAMEELGGEERLKAAKIMESVYGAKSNYEDAQLAFLKVAGSSKADKAREKMEAARDDMQKVISLAAENGLDNELFEQAESTSWLGGLGNAIQRGVLMSEMSDYTPDFLTNTLDADEMQKFIEIASEIEKLPTSSTMKRVRETKSDGFLDAMGNLLFDNPAAIPEMFVESLSSFLPAAIKSMIVTVPTGAAIGTAITPGAGTLAGAGVGAKASWGVASFVLEASGMALEGMQELGVDWKNPKVFAAAWTNESIRNKIQKKMVQKGAPIAAADMLTGFMAGKVMGVANHTGNAMFKGGKLLDKAAWNKSAGSVARFTTFQKTRNAAAELGFDSTMGMSGEYLGQWAAKEPGEAWDWDAIAAEGLVGVGPGILSSALEMRGRNANYFSNAPIEISGEQTTETGTTGTVTRAGYSAPYQTFNDAESMGDYLSTLPNANPEAVEFTKDWIAKLYAKNPEAMANLKIAISPRTPDANMENRGTFEARDGQTLIYLNEKEFSADPMATFMHEAGHLARVITMDEKQLMDVWSTIGKDAQLDAYAQYYTKRVGISFKDLDEATQAKVESAFNKTDNAVLAEEWFSYQFGQYLLGENSQVENDVKAELKTYADQLGDAYTQYSGTDAKGKDLFKLMFDQLGLGPAPETTINQPAPQPGINSDPQAALNAMPGTPQEKSMIARALNAMAGQKLLTESASFYTNMERQAVVAASEKEVDEQSEEGAEKKKTEEKAPQKSYKQNQGPLLPAQEAKLRAKQPQAKGSLPDQREAAETEISQLDRLIPESEADRKNLGRALATVRQVEKTLTDEDALNKRIDEAVNKLGNKASVGSIIAEVLRFGPMIDAAPISIIKELRKEISQIERGKGKQRLQTTKAVEDMLAEARERIDDVVGQLENRVAEIDKQIDSLKKGADVKEAQKEIKSLEEKKALAEAYIQVIAPEQRTFEWRDTVHSLYYVKRITKEGVSGRIDLTLGMLANMKDFDKYEIYSTVNNKRQKKTENQKPHHVLWDFVNGGFDEKKVKGDRNQPKSFLGGKSLNQYLMLLEAARASARWKQQKNIGSDAITTDSRVVSYPENFGEETTFGAVVAERIRRRMNRSVKDEEGKPVKDKDGKAVPQIERVPVFTENPTTEEVLALKIAGGATLEGLGDPSDSHKDFDMALYVVERQRMQEEQISSTEAGKADLILDLNNQFEYAEESEDPFMRVKPGAPLSKTLSQIISLTARRQFLDKYDKVVKEDVEGEKVEKKARLEALEKMRETIDGQIVEGYTELVKNPKSKLFAQRLNAVVPYPKQLVKDQSTEVNTAGFEVKNEKNFNFRRPLEDTDVTVKAENGHGAFTASKVYETFDVIKAYAKGRELKAGEFEKQRTTIDQTEQNIDRPTTMETGADLLSSVDINAVDFAQWFLGGEKQSEKNKGDTGRSRAARQMIKLADIPSSQYTEKTINQLGGGLGEGLLPFVFADFITAMHKKFGVKGFDDQIQTIRDRINEISQEQVNEQGTRTKEAGVIKPADLETLANDMVDVSKPIVQAVLDAEAIDVYGQFDPRSETVLERDTQMGEATDADENSAEIRDDSGNEDTQVASKKSDTDEKQTEAGETIFGRGDTDRQALRERIMLEYKDDPKVAGALEGMSYEQLSEFMKEDMGKEVNELLQKELERRATRREFNQAFTSDGSGKILNSDAGKPINDLNVVRKIIALTKKRIPLTRIAELGSQWDYDELSAIHFKARDRSTYEGGKSDVQVAEELLKSLKSARAAMAEGDAERAQQETAFIEKLMSNDMVMNNKWSDINDDPEAIDLQVEAEGFGGSISDLITKARKFKKDGTSPRTLNSDAGRVLTSDVNPNLTKATLLSKIAGDRELKNEFKEWAATRKESYDKGSFRMNMIDRMSPVKLLSQSSLEVFEKLGLKKGSLLHNWLDVHGRSHQYFGKGGNGLEQSRLDYYDPLTEIMRKHNVTQKEAGEYLIARAAPSKNLQIEAKAEEVLSDMRKEDEQGKGKQYKELYDFYYDKDGNFIRNSGVETKKALEVMANMESKPEFVEFLKEFLPVYYDMNKDGLDQLSYGQLIMSEIRDAEGKKIQSIDEKTAMITAASRFDFNTGKADKYGNKYTSKVKLADNYAYSPLQGFEGETEQFFDQEEAWEEFGSKSTGAGKGFNQPKGALVLQGAFGRKSDGVKSYGPDPVTVVGNAINQHTSAMIRAKKNEVSQSFGNMYALLYSVLNPTKNPAKDSSEFFDFANQDPELKEIFETLQTIHEPENKDLLKELTAEFNKVFDKPFEPSETKMAYEVKTDDAGIADSKIGLVRRTLSNEFKNDQNVFVFRRAGQPYFIRFNPKTDEGLRMADAMNNLRYESLPPILGGFNVGTRLMAKMFTSANLAFILPNFFRDVLTARIHLSEDNKKVLIKDALNRKNLAGFMKSIYQTEADIKNGINPNRKEEISKILALRDPKKILESGNRQAMYQYYKENGGKVDMFRHPTLVEKIKDIQKSLDGKDGWTKASWKKFWDFVDTANTAVENSIRASTFWAAIKDGRGPDEAAVIARNVTVDFNQKGNLTQTFGSLYVFFGASMNSIDRFFTTFSRRSPKERAKLIAGIAGAAFIINILNRLMDDDEDEEMPDYDTISSYKRDTNAILPLPAGLPEFFNDEKDTGFFSLPLPLGYNLFWTMGQVMGDMFAKNVFGRGGAGLVEATTRFTDSAMSAFNPVGGSSGLAVALTPTPFVPLIELYANKNFMGSPIRYADRPFEVPKPGHMQDPKGTPEHWNKLSKAINSFMGGSDDVKGSFAGMLGNNPLYYRSDEDITFDISGNQMRHLVMGYLGGPGQKADALFGSLFSAGSGKPSIENVNDIPIVNRFLRATTYGSATRGTFYEVRDAVKNAEKAVKSAKQINAKTYTAVLNDNRELLKLSSSISQLDKQKNKMRRLKKQIEGSKTLTEEQKTQRVDDLQKKELNLMVKVIKQAQSLGIS